MFEGLVSLLRRHPEFSLSTVSEAACPDSVDVVVADYITGTDVATRPIGCGRLAPSVVIVTQYDKEWDIRSALGIGVRGYLTQHCQPEELVEAIHEAHAGRRFLCQRARAQTETAGISQPLTGRESDVLNSMARGHCNKQIARDLGIGIGTVKSHIKGILTKLSAATRTQAVVLAGERGLVRREGARTISASSKVRAMNPTGEC
jgi:DNA-binding NarL/FixJ family response regulator